LSGKMKIKLVGKQHYRRVGWVGFSDNKPHFEVTTDDYTEIEEDGTPVLNVYRVKREARKRYEDVREVFVRE
jgi:hypothetical protein